MNIMITRFALAGNIAPRLSAACVLNPANDK
jgi:hypothetical protein